jgi:hypothetical protein
VVSIEGETVEDQVADVDRYWRELRLLINVSSRDLVAIKYLPVVIKFCLL